MSYHEVNDHGRPSYEMAAARGSEEEQILTVSDLTSCLQQIISEDTFQSLSVKGEVSGLRETQNGHVFFILRDERSQISCVLWCRYRSLVPEIPVDGEEVIVSGGLRIKKLNQKLTSEIQLQATRIQRGVGKGSFWKLFEQTKQKLAAEGLFFSERKRSIPQFPRRVALITSPVGAVLHDFLSIAHRQDPSVEIVVFPSSVQGDDARESLVRALQLVNSPETERMVGEIDVVVIARGGGSSDDLFVFNTEEVVRAVASSRIPTVSAIGHEPDVTLTDLAADLRAATPSAAAQQVIPNRSTLLANIAQLHDKLTQLTRMYLALLENKMMRLSERKWFKEPNEILWSHHQACGNLLNRAQNAYSERLRHHSKKIAHLSGRLAYHSPHAQIHRLQGRLSQLGWRLSASVDKRYERMGHTLNHQANLITQQFAKRIGSQREAVLTLTSKLDALNPYAVLERGYALIRDPLTNKVLSSSHEFSAPQQAEVVLADGTLKITVEEVYPSDAGA